MRIAFNLAIFAGAIFYAWVAFADLALLTANGRLGPGFFPRVISVLLIAMLFYSFIADRKFGLTSNEGSSNARDVVVFAALSFLFVAMMNFLGGPVAMVVFMLLALTIFNPGRHLHNVLLSLLLPVAIFLMFDTWLNASLPEGIFPFLG
ncbi:MAG: tripartite tricarboxylate transporter TctB family protein [Trueperaceae bacterium]